MENRIMFTKDTLPTRNTDECMSTIKTGNKHKNQTHRRPRTSFTQVAVRLMEKEFEINKFPDIGRRETIATEIGVPESRVQVWFQNRRARVNKRRRSCDDEKPEKRRRRDSTSSNYDNKRSCNVDKKNDDIPTFTENTSERHHHVDRVPRIYQRMSSHGTNIMNSHSQLPSYPVTSVQYSLVADVHTSSFQTHFQNVVTPQATSRDQRHSDVDNFLQGMFRFSASRATEVVKSSESRRPEVCFKPYILTVPAKKVKDCSVNELQCQDSGR